MAVVGEQLLQPESGMQRIDDSNLNIKYIGNFFTTGGINNYNGTAHGFNTNDSTEIIKEGLIDFYCYTSKLYIIASMFNTSSSDMNINIDGIDYSFSLNNGSNSVSYQAVAFTINLDKKVHHITINSKDGIRYVFDAIDIDEDGRMCTQEEYLLQEGEAEFPIKVADDSVQTEDDVLSYAKTLVNGEKQLLVSEILKSLYVTDGNGGMTKISTGEGSSSISVSYFGDPTI